MIIFNLDGTLSDCKHRQHFVNPLAPSPTKKNHTLLLYSPNVNIKLYHKYAEGKRGFFYQETHKRFEPDYKSFYEACDEDQPINQSIEVLHSIIKSHWSSDIEIWSGRCESVRKKTEKWLHDYARIFIRPYRFRAFELKMRPVGDNTSDYQLKERWLDEAIAQGKTIDFVFDDRPKVIRMWRRRGIFVFNCCQQDGEF